MPQFSQTLIELLQQSGTDKTFNKGEYLTREGDIEQNLYWIGSGAVRVFYLSDIEEFTIRLGYSGSLITSLSSFFKGTPSEFYIEAIRKTTVKIISRTQLLETVHRNNEHQAGYIQLLELLVTQQLDREIDLLTSSPSERLKRVLERSPHVFQEIPLKYIASYLRMKPETLSRIRSGTDSDK